jgi:hypothetical protein
MNSRLQVNSLTLARAKIAGLFAIYAPSLGHDAAISALDASLTEFEAAVREDEHDAITYAGGAPLANVPTGTSALDTSEADAIEPPRESTPEEVAKVYAVPPPIPPMPSPPMSDEELAAKEEVDAERSALDHEAEASEQHG